MFRHLFPIRIHGEPVHVHIGKSTATDAQNTGETLISAIRDGRIDATEAISLAESFRQLASDIEITVGDAE